MQWYQYNHNVIICQYLVPWSSPVDDRSNGIYSPGSWDRLSENSRLLILFVTCKKQNATILGNSCCHNSWNCILENSIRATHAFLGVNDAIQPWHYDCRKSLWRNGSYDHLSSKIALYNGTQDCPTRVYVFKQYCLLRHPHPTNPCMLCHAQSVPSMQLRNIICLNAIITQSDSQISIGCSWVLFELEKKQVHKQIKSWKAKFIGDDTALIFCSHCV